jgi:release factor glutamine methyltransferase
LVFDIGAGSGNIGIALAHTHSDVSVIATDVSTDAIDVARENARRHGLSDRFRFVAARSLSAFAPDVKADLLVSNPPYIPADDPQVQPSVHDFEPHIALYSGSDGTEILGDLIADAPRILKPGGALVCEIGYSQANAIREIVAKRPAWSKPVFHRSIAGHERVLALRLRA